MLAEAALLRAGRSGRSSRSCRASDRLRLAVQAVLEVGAHDRRRRLRAERQRAVAAVGERVHLLRDDVRALARRAAKQLRVLEHRRVDPAVAVQRAQPLELPDHLLPERLLGREGCRASRAALRSVTPAAPRGTDCGRARRRASSAGRGRSRRRSPAGSGRRARGSTRASVSQSPAGGRCGRPSRRRGRRRRRGSRPA